MKSGKHALLLLMRAGMEIAWRYAWSGFLSLAILQRPFPLPVALGAFAAAAFGTRLPRNRNWRRFQGMLLHIAGFTVAAFLFLHHLFFRDLPVFDGDWITQLISLLKVPPQWFILLPMVFCLLLFWMGGRAVEIIPRTYLPVCLQFDKGLGAFFLLFLIKFLIHVKGGPALKDPASGYLVIAFLLFSLFSIGLARHREDAAKSFLAGYHGIGVVLGFITMVVFCGAALILLAFPYLAQMADVANDVLKAAAAPLGPIIVAILRFIFAPRRLRIESGGAGTAGPDANMAHPALPGGENTLLQVIGWCLVGLLALAAIGVCGYLLYWLVRWLLNRAPSDSADLQPSDRLSNWLFWLAAVFRSLRRRVLFLLGKVDSAAAVYAGILRWGQRSGLRPVASETPGEYGSRLMQKFPQLREEIEVIIEAFNREAYGDIATEAHLLIRVATALRRMQSPRHWPSRMQRWFMQQT